MCHVCFLIFSPDSMMMNNKLRFLLPEPLQACSLESAPLVHEAETLLALSDTSFLPISFSVPL
jgi:hypothetical protein